ncbi:MAG: hypothetical protein EOP06_28300, partial [Proteobacteria bacterium]
MKTLCLLLILCFSSIAQRPVELVFDAIQTEDSNTTDRTFRLTYYLTNTSNKPISFLLNLSDIVPVVSSSMSFSPHYKLYKDGKSVDVAGVFTSGSQRATSMESYKKYVDSIRELETNVPLRKFREGKAIMERIVRLNAGESKTCSILLGWNRERYQKQDENEYFLDPNAKYELELSMHLMRSELNGRDSFSSNGG